MSRAKGDDDAVGYGKPPKRTQFKPGQSGNPKGRRKGIRNFKTEINEVLATKVTVTQGKQKKIVSTLTAILLRVREKALSGDMRASDSFVRYAMLFAEEPANAGSQAAPEDDQILAALEAEILQRVEAAKPSPMTKARRGRVGRRA